MDRYFWFDIEYIFLYFYNDFSNKMNLNSFTSHNPIDIWEEKTFSEENQLRNLRINDNREKVFEYFCSQMCFICLSNWQKNYWIKWISGLSFKKNWCQCLYAIQNWACYWFCHFHPILVQFYKEFSFANTCHEWYFALDDLLLNFKVVSRFLIFLIHLWNVY